jgi:hypothetical protein
VMRRILRIALAVSFGAAAFVADVSLAHAR